jgi:hypothetical protein
MFINYYLLIYAWIVRLRSAIVYYRRFWNMQQQTYLLQTGMIVFRRHQLIFFLTYFLSRHWHLRIKSAIAFICRIWLYTLFASQWRQSYFWYLRGLCTPYLKIWSACIIVSSPLCTVSAVWLSFLRERNFCLWLRMSDMEIEWEIVGIQMHLDWPTQLQDL